MRGNWVRGGDVQRERRVKCEWKERKEGVVCDWKL